MAFEKNKIDPTGSGSKGAGSIGLYSSETDNKAAIKGAGYFNPVANELEGAKTKAMVIVASDATFLAKVTVASGVVTIADLDGFA